MKKIILVAAAIISLSDLSFAQTAQTASPSANRAAMKQMSPQQKAKTMTDKMQEKLNLTSSQNQSIYKVNLEIANRMEKAKASKDKSAMRSIRSYRMSEYKKILTNDQMATVNTMVASRKSNRATAN